MHIEFSNKKLHWKDPVEFIFLTTQGSLEGNGVD